jgi:tRNA(adenine34) deaminase
VDYEQFMRLALSEARISGDDVPVGAVIVDSKGELLASGHNRKEERSDATSHAEIEVIRAAGAKLGNWRLENCTLFVTLEPCAMCAGAIVAARIPRVVFGAWDEKVGAAGSLYDLLRDRRLSAGVEVVPGVLGEESTKLLKTYFSKQRPSSEKES